MKNSISFSSFLSLYVPILLIGLLLLFFSDKFLLHKSLNGYHTSTLDVFFYYLTFLGHGVFIVLMSIFFFLKNKKQGVLIFCAFIFSASITQGLKHFVFDDAMRPYYYIDSNLLHVPLVENIELHMHNSFPSGHTTSIFSFCSMISLFYNRKFFGVFLFILAFLTAYSRIYLSQHFMADVLFGSFIGVFSSYLLFYLNYNFSK